MKESFQFLNIMSDHRQSLYAMATIIRVEGSSYRHEGAKMLFAENGKSFGTISAGCIEDDLFYRAKEVMATGEPKIITYDLRSEDDLDWGSGTGCNGKIVVYLEAVQWNQRDQQITDKLNRGQKVATVRGLGSEVQGVYLGLSEEGQIIGKESNFQSILKERLAEFLESELLLVKQTIIKPEWEFLFELYEPADYLYIFGAGPDVEPLVKLVHQYHFLPIIIDPRSSRCNWELFPEANALICEHPEQFLSKGNIHKNSFVLIMTHNFVRDQKILKYFVNNQMNNQLNTQPKYIGILGPRRRTERLLYPGAVPDWVHSPVGVNIYAEGAEEISVSILAELIKARNEKRSRKGSEWKKNKFTQSY